MQHEKMRIGNGHAIVSIDIKIEYNNFTAYTVCMLLLLFLFKQIIYFCSSAYKRYGFVTINL